MKSHMLALAAWAAVSAASLGQNPVPAADPEVLIPRTTYVDFTPTPVDGEIMRPQHGLIFVRKSSDFESLIRVRSSFGRELALSTDGL